MAKMPVTSLENYSVGGHITAFVDLLGFGKKLLELEKLPECSDEDSKRQLAARTIAPVFWFRKTFHDFYSEYEHNSGRGFAEEIKELGPEAKAAWDEAHIHEATIDWFSDCATISVPVNRESHLTTLHNLYVLISALVAASFTLLAMRQPLRGGIDIGYGVEIGEGEIVGAGLVRAHHIEAQVAIYPRIVLSHRIAYLLRTASSRTGQNPREMLESGIAKMALLLTYLDNDSNLCINTFAPHGLASLEPRTREHALAEIRAFVSGTLQRCLKDGDERMASKYGYLAALLHRFAPVVDPTAKDNGAGKTIEQRTATE